MTIAGQTPSSLIESVLEAQVARETMQIALLRKSQDMMKKQGEAMVQMLERAGNVDPSRLLDAYA